MKISWKETSFREPVLIAIESLQSHKMRSFLTLLGIIISVSTLIVVVSLIEGVNRYISSKVANFGANVFLVSQFPLITDLEDFVKLRKRNRIITWDDYQYLRDNMTLARNVGLQHTRMGRSKHLNQAMDEVSIRGVTANLGEIDIEEPAIGRYITDSDNEHRSEVTMIGSDLAQRFFGLNDPLGKTVYIDGRGYEVVGVAKPLGSTLGRSQDSFAYIPIQTYRKIYGAQESGTVNIQAMGPQWMLAAEDEARMLMRAHRHVSPASDDNFGIIEPSALMGLWTNLTGTIASGAVVIVSVFLVIGGIVIMNIMLASVRERTREIGIRKSLGATRRAIMLQFVIEASVMSAAGGVVGVLIAVVIALVVGHATPVPMAIPLMAIGGAVLASTAIGLFFGVYPASQAAKLDPIEALSFET